MPYINSLSIGNWWKGEAERKNLKMTGKMHRKRKRKNGKNFHISFGTELNCVRIQKKANWIKTTRIQPEKEGKKIIYLLHLIRMRLDVCSFVRLLVCLFALFFVLCAMILVQVLAASNDLPCFCYSTTRTRNTRTRKWIVRSLFRSCILLLFTIFTMSMHRVVVYPILNRAADFSDRFFGKYLHIYSLLHCVIGLHSQL